MGKQRKYGRSNPTYFEAVYTRLRTNFAEIIEHRVKPNLDVIFTNNTFDPNEKVIGSDQDWFLNTLKRMMGDLKELEKEYNYIIFDTPPGWQLILVNLIALSNKAIILLRPNFYEVNGTKKLLEILYRRAKPTGGLDIYLLFNQVPEVDMKAELKEWISSFQGTGIKYAGCISCSCKISYEIARGTTIFPSNHEFNQELQNVLSILYETS